MSWMGTISQVEASLAQNWKMWGVGLFGSGQGFSAPLLWWMLYWDTRSMPAGDRGKVNSSFVLSLHVSMHTHACV